MNDPPLSPSPPLPLPPSRKRVLFVLGSLAGGGAERQTLAWLRHLDRARFEPLLYVISREGELAGECPDDVPIFAYDDRAGASRVYIPGGAYRRQVRDLQRVIHETRADRLVTVSVLMTLLASGLTSVPPRWFAVEMADPRRDVQEQFTRFRGIKKRMLRRAYRRARPVAVSEGVREGISEFYNLPIERTDVLRNVIDVTQVEAQAAEPGPELEPGCFHIVNVARLVVAKGHSYLLETMRRLVHDQGHAAIRLHLLGDGALRGELEAVVARHGLKSHVTFHGFHPNPPAFVAQCDLFCLSSIYEGLPLALLEAMACGTPVVATDCPSGPREVLADGLYGLLAPEKDARGLAETIEQVINDQSAARNRARAAREHVHENYSIAVAMREWERLLQG